MKLLELRGYKSLRAFNAFHALMLGLKMLPAYMGETYDAFFERLEAMPEADQEKMIRQAVQFVELQKEEVEAMLSFCCDPNGVPYSAENLCHMGPAQIAESIVAVSMQIVKIKIDIISDAEKKNLKIG